MPFASVTWICSVVCAPAWPGTGDGVMMIVGRGTGITVTEVDTVLLLPLASSTVPVTTYVPAALKTWDAAAVPVTAPRSCTPLPSPQLTLRSRTAAPLVVAAVTTNENVAGSPALGEVVGGVMT